mmetsp:Transcript_20083/g.41372  ORF Transcript_20083/g.41372 Transcript_20083/m.41372 type:complete len:214 (-) Transcript_20083:235-876(-)
MHTHTRRGEFGTHRLAVSLHGKLGGRVAGPGGNSHQSLYRADPDNLAAVATGNHARNKNLGQGCPGKKVDLHDFFVNFQSCFEKVGPTRDAPAIDQNIHVTNFQCRLAQGTNGIFIGQIGRDNVYVTCRGLAFLGNGLEGTLLATAQNQSFGVTVRSNLNGQLCSQASTRARQQDGFSLQRVSGLLRYTRKHRFDVVVVVDWFFPVAIEKHNA